MKILKASLRRLMIPFVERQFHRLYYGDELRTWQSTTWAGIPILKCPLDVWIYQEIIWKTRPDLIIETGTFNGGSALYMANLLDMIGSGRIITVDIEDVPERPQHPQHPQHPRITYVRGSSVDPVVVASMTHAAESAGRVMVILDSDHSELHVTAELAAYSPLVSKGCYLIVEDTNVNGHPAGESFGPGPMEAVIAFLRGNREFVVDRNCERLHLTFNPNGYLLRI
jgi:cephalosporin hydroxylase